MKHLKYFFVVVILSFSFSCSVNDDEMVYTPKSILNLVEESPNYEILTYALSKTGLSNVLNDENSRYTLFAPSDMVFTRFLSDNGYQSIDEVPTELLRKILLNHVLAEAFEYRNLRTGYYNTAAQFVKDNYMRNLSMHIEEVNMRITLNGESMITQGNVRATNGVIHVINRVVPLPTIVTFAKADENLSVLLAALTRPDLTADFPSILSTNSSISPAPFTVFAPTNGAFNDLLKELGISQLNDIDEPTLKSTLTYHVIAESITTSSQLSDNLNLETLGGTITANLTGGATLTDGNNRVSNIIAVDIQADNGVIHVIDKVILPN
jgi:transforming growth factor-beta-induced protein